MKYGGLQTHNFYEIYYPLKGERFVKENIRFPLLTNWKNGRIIT